MENLTITDKTVIAFFNENPHLDVNNIMHVFIDILKQLSTNLSSKIDNTMTTQILSIVSELKGELYKLNADISMRLNDAKREYITDIKELFLHSELSTHDKIGHVLDKSNEALLNKTTLLMSEIIPKSNDKNYASIESCFKQFFGAISEDTKTLLKMNSADKTDGLAKDIDKNISKMFSIIQDSLFNAIQSSESRTFTNIQQIHENILCQKQIQENLSTELAVFLNKYKNNSSIKGAVSENELYTLLQYAFPTDYVRNTSTETAACDFCLTRKDKSLPTIYFENKDYTTTVDSTEVEKFQRDLQERKAHGIFISQHSPIVFKSNFQIDFIENRIHLYIPNAGYDVEKIKLAVGLIDSLSIKLKLMISEANDDCYELSLEDFENLKQEYLEFAQAKLCVLECIKTMTKQLTTKLDAIQLPTLRRITIGNTEPPKPNFVCEICNVYSGSSKAVIAGHRRKCQKEHALLSNTGTENIIIKTK
jgi:hypothetical protein